MDLRNGNCLELMKTLPDKSVDLLICDLPYGETNCKWDTKIDMEKFWKEFKRIRKSPRVACIHFCSTKFGYTLIKSWEKGFKMDMCLKKRNKTGGLQSRHRPMRNHEMVYFFYDQAPKYNRDKYHKRIQATPNPKTNKEEQPLNNSTIGKKHNLNSLGIDLTKHRKYANQPNYIPLLPASVLEEDEKNLYGIVKIPGEQKFGTYGFEPPNPASVIEEKDQVYGKACGGKGPNSKEFRDKLKKDGLSSLYTPPNPASVLEETDIWLKEKGKNGTGWDTHKPKYGNEFEPPNPVSVLEEDKCLYGFNKKDKQDYQVKDLGKNHNFEPPNPASVLEEKNNWQKKAEQWGYEKCSNSFDNNEKINGGRRIGANFEPPNPASVLEEDEPKRKTIKNRKGMGESHDIYPKENQTASCFEPPNPASVLENETDIYGEKANDRHERYLECGCGYYEPPNPGSVFDSEKVFIGKRNHQTEKPLDILEFFLKYWTDEDDVVLDPTMGSGSTGVACKKLKRKFIGFELDPKIYEVADKRINKIDLKIEPKKNIKKTKKI